MFSIPFFDRDKDKPITKFQNDLKEFLVKYKFNACTSDDHGNLIMIDEENNHGLNELVKIKEFTGKSDIRNSWKELQKRYDDGER